MLSEGLIKLPATALKTIVNKTFGLVLGRLYQELPTIRPMLSELAKDRDIKLVPTGADTKAFSVPIDLTELPKKYQVIDAAPKLGILVDWRDSKRSKLGTRSASGLYTHDETKPVITIGVKEFIPSKVKRVMFEISLSERQRKDPLKELRQDLEGRMDIIESTIEHELTHYVQYQLLKPLDDRQAQMASEDEEIKLGKRAAYYNSPVEFHPTIRSAVTRYITDERLNLLFELRGTRSFWIRVFTGATPVKTSGVHRLVSTSENGGLVKPDVFFLALRSADMNKWKLAVKLFTQELERKYPT